MRILVMANGPFGVPAFRRLLASRHEVVAVVVRPTHSRGKRKPPPSPVRVLAEAQGLPVFDPPSVNKPEFREQLAALEPELFYVCDFGQILSSKALAIAKHGGINLHASLLPAYRGAAPINWAIYNGDQQTGVTVIHMTPGMDAGPILNCAATPIEPTETTPELEDRLAEIGAGLVEQAVDALASGTATSTPQDESLVTQAPRLQKTDGAIDWNRSAAAIAQQVRALKPWPGTFTSWQSGEARELRVILDQVAVEPLGVSAEPGAPSFVQGTTVEPGTTAEVDKNRLIIATGDGALVIERLQPAGKKPMPIADFLRGHRVAVGDRWV
jgi:methionyl-tRNA formyltransferase